MSNIQLAESDDAIAACYPVMAQLRPHLTPEAFLQQVRRQQKESGFRLAFASQNGRPAALAGFRVSEYLAWGKVLYVDDLVTDAACRSTGLGKQLFGWLVNVANREGCDQFHLDSGVQRFDAHRFYLRERMLITCHHFALALRPERK